MTRLVRAAEAARILVFRSGVVGNNTHRSLDVDEFRGFALSDPMAPAVFVNVRDAKTAQIFTFSHELAHLWLGESGVSDLNGETPGAEISDEVERFCDRAATEFLVPEGSFHYRWPEPPLDLGQVAQDLARAYRVSTTVILRRALELGRISRQDFYSQLEIERSRQTSSVRSGSGGSFRNSFVARNSAPLIAAVFESVLEGKALHREAATVLDIKTSTLSRLADEYRLAR